MRKVRLTQKRIAEKLGISVTTVSRALRDLPDISQQTKDAVVKLAQEGNYLPNTNAIGLRKRETHRIGVIIPEIVHFYFSSMISGIMECAEKNGYSVLLTQTNESYQREILEAEMLFSTIVDGLLVCLSNESKTLKHFEKFQDYGIPVVFFDKVKYDLEASTVVVEDHKGAFDATQHLIDVGCKRIAHLKGPRLPVNAKRRLQGYLDALETNKIAIDESIIKEGFTMSRREAFEFTKELLEHKNPIDGIFAANDLVAIGAIDAVKEKGLRIPEDVAIVGFSDSEIADIVSPKLSSIHQPGFELGHSAMEVLLEEIPIYAEDKTPEFKNVVLATSLVVRESSKRIKAQE